MYVTGASLQIEHCPLSIRLEGDKMAQKVQVMLLCDLDNGDIGAEETFGFSLGNTAYEIDVCAKHAQQLREGLEPFIEHSRKSRSAASSSRRQRSSGRRQATAYT